jgi:hypothetical protein
MLNKFLRDPLFLFIVLGSGVFALYYSLSDSSDNTVELSEVNRKVFTQQFELLTGRKATAQDIARIERDYIEEEVLFQEAIEAGMHLSDPEVRSQLVEEMRYQVTGALPDADETTLVSYYLAHIDRYYVEPTYSFQHVYFEQKPEEPEAILTALTAGEEVKGDEFWRGRVMPNYGVSMIRGMFGQPFVDTLAGKPIDTWFGPEESLLGWHYVVVTQKTQWQPLSFDDARMQVTNDYTVDKLQGAVEAYIQSIGDKYHIIRHSKE